MSSLAQKPVFKLGRLSFCIEDAKPNIEKDLLALLPATQNVTSRVCCLNQSTNLRSLLNEVLDYHDDCIWIDAACLISKQGRRVLIAGKSGAGKSTTAIALVWEFGWTALAEDLVLIDPKQEDVISFASPFSLKPGTLDILKAAIKRLPESVIDGEWVPNKAAQTISSCSVKFDLVFYFDTASGGNEFSVGVISPAEYIRLLLPCSNILHKEGALDYMPGYLSNAACYRVSGGTLTERLDCILHSEQKPAEAI